MVDRHSISENSSGYFTPLRLDSSRSSGSETFQTAKINDIEANDEENMFQFNEHGHNGIREPEFDRSHILSLARHNKAADIERYLKEGFPVDSLDDYGNTMLMIACQNGHIKVLKLALRYGANANCQNTRGNTALHFLFAYGYGNTLGAYLISKGASDRFRNRKNKTCYDANPLT